MNSQRNYPRQISFEFFPPKNAEAAEKLRKTREQLAAESPEYFSVTFGAGGSTQQGTFDLVREILASGSAAAPHLSCITSSKERIREQLAEYRAAGVTRIVALRGDLPSGYGHLSGELHYANELVSFIREESGDAFHIEVAAYPEFHPQATSAAADMANFKRKVEAGANSAITQYFFAPDAYYRFVNDCERMGLQLPIVPGIMPITNFTQLARFSNICGAEIPRWIYKRLEGFGDDRESIRAFGLDVTLKLCRDLLDAGAPGLHFYTMNQAGPTCHLLEQLGLGRSAE